MESSLDRAAAAQPNVGRPMVHRLNRVEYAYAIQDLLDLEVDPVALLPPDESGYGFDNISDLLGTSPMLLERYLNAAGKLSALAVGDPTTVPGNQTFIIRQDRSQDTQIDGMPIGTFGGGLARVTLPLDGEYVINAKLFRTNLGAMRGLELPNQAEFTVDRTPRAAGRSSVARRTTLAHLTNPTVAGDEIDSRLSVRLPLKAGPHVITVGWIRRVGGTAVEAAAVHPQLDRHDRHDGPSAHRSLRDHRTRSIRPGPGTPRAGAACSSAVPRGPAAEDACARRIVSTLGRRAFRGQMTDGDLARLMEFYRRGHKERGFEGGIQLALQRILASPKFVWRVERDPVDVRRRQAVPPERRRAGVAALVLPVEFDSRRPAARARAAGPSASAGRCSTSRCGGCWPMRKIERFVTNFAGQWLYLRNLKNQIPDSVGFPNFDDNLRQAFLRETELFVGSIVRGEPVRRSI